MPQGEARKQSIVENLLQSTLNALQVLGETLNDAKFIGQYVPLVSTAYAGVHVIKTVRERAVHVYKTMPAFLQSQIETVNYLTGYLFGEDAQHAFDKLTYVPSKANQVAVDKINSLTLVIDTKVKMMQKLCDYWNEHYSKYASGQAFGLKDTLRNTLTNKKDEVEKMISQLCNEIFTHFTEISTIFALRSLIRGEVKQEALVNYIPEEELQAKTWTSAVMGGRRTRRRRGTKRQRKQHARTKRR
jgi:hypothetical protein